MNTTTDFAQQITITDFDLLKSGLRIVYNIGNEEKLIELDPQDTCDLLHHCGLITDWKCYDGMIVLWFKYENERGDVKTTYQEWDEYIIFTKLDEMVAEILVRKYESLIVKNKAA